MIGLTVVVGLAEGPNATDHRLIRKNYLLPAVHGPVNVVLCELEPSSHLILGEFGLLRLRVRLDALLNQILPNCGNKNLLSFG